ncbi:MAG: hypothetical protein KIT69_09275 [Propionibacteriaceae bacterium]|nr:hypothetical protein [Propionibacteriaceae bacterium]
MSDHPSLWSRFTGFLRGPARSEEQLRAEAERDRQRDIDAIGTRMQVRFNQRP